MRRALIAAVLALAACEAPPDAADTSSPRIVVAPGFQTISPENLPAFFDCLRENGRTIVSAHRGGPDLGELGYAENAIPTFEHTMRFAAAFLEVDVSQTADGVLVLMHDDRADRTATGAGAIADLDMAQLLAFQLEDARGRPVSARVPTLAEALEWAGGKTVLELDIKRGVAYEDVVRVVRDANAMGRVIFVTYSVDGAARLVRLAPQAMIYTTISSVRELDTLQRRGVDLSHIVAWLGTDVPLLSLVEALAERGVETRFGMFGEGRSYTDAMRAHAQVVAVEDSNDAFVDLDAADGEEGAAALQCVGAR